ncbi:MAG TPA: Uma2 family endonuclease [Anaerolineae bacterium]|nr:Uma2 family endonuclease [Anaerolineae bacterium]
MEAVMELQPVAAKQAVMTEEEFETWCDEDVKAEYVDGEVIVHSPVSTRHSDTVWFIGYLLRTIVQQHDLGRVLGPEVQVRLRPGLRRVPDLLFVTKGRADIIQPTLVEGAPDLIVEIVSPDSVERDWREKYLECQTAGVGEYWVVDLEYQRLAVYRLDEQGRYQAVPAEEGLYRSQVLPGFWLRAEWLWQEPLPNELDVAREMGLFS